MVKKIHGNKQALIGIGLIGIVSLVALFAPFLSPNDPNLIDTLQRFQPSSLEYPLGTDQLGRCILSRLLFGASYSLGIAVPTLLVLGIIGATLGTAAAYVGGRLERFFLIVCDVFMAFPPLVLMLALIGSIGQGIISIIVATICTMWAWFTKITWSYARLEKRKDYVLASQIAGCSGRRMVFGHLVPNLLPQFTVYLSTGIAGFILMVSSLSFLGIGFEAGTPEWGAMLGEAKSHFYSHPMLVVYPGLCILFTTAGFNLFGEALRDIFSPEEASE